MFKLIIGLTVLSGLNAQVARRNLNVCENVTASDLSQFKNDFASCGSYFWCDGTQARPTEPCRDGFLFDEENRRCVQGDDCDECPEFNIAVTLKHCFWKWT